MSKKVERASMTQTDDKGRVTREPRDNASGNAVNFRWWKTGTDNKANAIAQTIKFIQTHQSGRLEQITVSTRLYGSASAYNLLGTAFTRASSINANPTSQRLGYNVCQSVIDTLVSKMAKNKIIPTFITNGGVWSQQKKAKQLTKFAQGLFYEQKVHEKRIDAFRDAAVWGTGILAIFEKNGRVEIERALPHEFVIDQIEAITTKPKQLHRVKIVDRAVAIEMFPEFEEELEMVSPSNFQEVGGQGSAADLITITESWHLKSGPDADDGQHVICSGDTVLFEEEWTKDYFPFAFVDYTKKVLGFWAQSACERLQNIQGEINRNMILIQKSLWMGGSFKVLLENGSKVVSQHLNNDVGAIIHYTGTPPQYITPPVVQPEMYQWVDSLIVKAYKQEGVSMMSASAEKPMGVDSGKAMRTLTDIEDDRFTFMEQMNEQFALEITRQAIEVVKDIYKDKKTYEVVFPATKFMETVDWKDICLDQDEYVLKAYPTSSLSNDLTGRLSEVQELMQAGLVSARTGKRLMDMPDVEMNDNLTNAAEDMLHKIFEDMLDDGVYRAPEPFYDLQLAKQLCMEYYNYADYMSAPEDRLQLLRNFNAQLDDIMGTLNPPPVPQPGGQPMAQPTATPQSNLLPNVAGGQIQ